MDSMIQPAPTATSTPMPARTVTANAARTKTRATWASAMTESYAPTQRHKRRLCVEVPPPCRRRMRAPLLRGSPRLELQEETRGPRDTTSFDNREPKCQVREKRPHCLEGEWGRSLRAPYASCSAAQERRVNRNGARGACLVLLPFGIEVDTLALVTGRAPSSTCLCTRDTARPVPHPSVGVSCPSMTP